MKEQDKLILINPNNLVQKVNTSISITNKLIAENNQQMIFDIFEKNPKLFVDLISEFYPLSKNIIRLRKNIWNWNNLSRNQRLNIDLDFIDEFKEEWDWTFLIKQVKFPINLSFIETHIEKINPNDLNINNFKWDIKLIQLFEKHNLHYNWKYFIESKGVTLSEELIEYLIENFIHEFDWDCLWKIKRINVDVLTIEKYKEKINWEVFSGLHNINWSIDLIDKFINYWDWSILSSNSSIPINKIYEKHKEKINLFKLSSNSSFNFSIKFLNENENFEHNWYGISENNKIIWDIESLELYKSKIKWHYLSKEYKFTKEMIIKFDNYINFKNISNNKNVVFDYEIINRYKDRLDFYYLSWRNDILWTEKLIADFSDKWNWPNLSNNESIEWTKELIGKFDNKLLFNFNESNPDSIYGSYFGASVYGLSSNKNTIWSNDLIKDYFEKWNWKELSKNENLPWTLELIEKYNDKWDWNNLSSNKNLPWSLEFFEKNIERWKWSHLSENENLQWSIEFIEKYKENWDWCRLSYNNGLKWNIYIINKYAEKIESSELIWDCIKDYINDELIIEILNKYE
jgi:hypothetical protein